MNNLDIDLDAKINNLELEWRLAYDGSIVARAEYQRLAAAAKGGAGAQSNASTKGSAEAIDMARERLERAEAKKARIMAKIERLEDSMLGRR